ncbi:hypothetical protein H1R20_g10449, partial [Candolleomyces eurysporus]
MENIRKPNDVFVYKDQARRDDILIPVMGPTGVGKSSFINNIFKKLGSSQPAETSDGFASCTTTVADYRIKVPSNVANRYPFARGTYLVLVDTPGFDNVSVSDTEILRRLAVWLAWAYDADMKENSMARLYNSLDSAWEIIEAILKRMEDSGVVLALQRQLVDQGKSLPQTGAAKALRAKISRLSESEHSSTDSNEARRKRLEALAKEAKELKIPLSKRIQGFFGIYG